MQYAKVYLEGAGLVVAGVLVVLPPSRRIRMSLQARNVSCKFLVF
jgi:hypothetical protein